MFRVRPKSFGVYSRATVVQSKVSIYRLGGSNVFVLRPSVPILGSMDDSIVIHTLPNGGNAELIQVFKSLDDNIESVSFIVGLDATPTIVDNFEGAFAWQTSDATNTPATQDINAYEGNYAMKISTTKNRSLNDKVFLSYQTAQDWSGYEFIKFYWQCNEDLYFRFYISDGVNFMYIDLPKSNVYTEQVIRLSSMIPDGGTYPDLTAVVEVGFLVIRDNENTTAYVDNIVLIPDSAVSFDVQILDLGSTPSVVPPFTVKPFDDGSTFTTFTLSNYIKNEVEIETPIGISDLSNLLVKGNFYGVRIFNVQGDWPLQIYGGISADPSLYMVYTSTDGTNFSELAGNSAHFYTKVELSQGSFLRHLSLHPEIVPNNSRVEVRCMLYNNEVIHHVINDTIITDKLEVTFEPPLFIPRGAYGLLHIYDNSVGGSWLIKRLLLYEKAEYIP